uniref:Uncharacterized protein n=1 Tax=Romanomermis culicivorax TaxID=13658 RepID=A0A915JJG5_ROMCU
SCYSKEQAVNASKDHPENGQEPPTQPRHEFQKAYIYFMYINMQTSSCALLGNVTDAEKTAVQLIPVGYLTNFRNNLNVVHIDNECLEIIATNYETYQKILYFQEFFEFFL